MNPQFNSYPPPPLQNWNQPPTSTNQQNTNMNGNQVLTNIIPQMANMNLSGGPPHEQMKQQLHQQMPPPQRFQNFNNPMQQTYATPQQQSNYNMNVLNNNNSTGLPPPPTSNSVQNGVPTSNQLLSNPPLSQPPAVLPIQSEIIDNKQYPTVSQLKPENSMAPPISTPSSSVSNSQPPATIPLNNTVSGVNTNQLSDSQNTNKANQMTFQQPPTSMSNSEFPPRGNAPPTVNLNDNNQMQFSAPVLLPPSSTPQSQVNASNDIKNVNAYAPASAFPPTSSTNQVNNMGYPPPPTNASMNSKYPRPPVSGVLPPTSKPQMPDNSSFSQNPIYPGGQQSRYPPPIMSTSQAPGNYSATMPSSSFPPLPGQQPSQSGMPPLPGQQPSQPGMNSMPPSNFPPLPGQQQSQPIMPPLPGNTMYGQGTINMPPQAPPTGMPMPNQKPMYPGSNSNMTQGMQNMPPYMQNMPPPSMQGMPPQQPGMPPQQPGMPPQQPGMPPQQPGMPPNMPQQAGGRNQMPPPGMYTQMPGNYPPTGGLAAAPQQRRLDPDQMPNPIEVMNENDSTYSGPFITNQPGLVPPLVTTEFVTNDEGNSGPRFIRSSMYSIPSTSDMIKQTAVPFSLIISPLAKLASGEIQVPIVDFGELGPVRCIRCKAYMSPNMQFIDNGRRFQCLLCKAITDVPAEYFCNLNHTGQRDDKYVRPELRFGTYEFVATKDYCRNNTIPKPPAIIFVIDVSYNNIKSGLVHLLCKEMKHIVKNLPVDQNCEKSLVKVGFITYNNTVHFYNINNNLAQPQMMIVGDVQEMFMPLLDGFLCDPEDSMIVIDALMEQIPKMFGDSRETETILLPAIQAGLEALKASECPGKLLVFNSSLPIAEAPGKLKNRDDRKLLGTDKEKTILNPQTNAYNNLGQDCVAAGCSVDLFVFNNSYIDIATIGQVSRLSGGEVYKYTYFQADIDGKRLVSDIIENISRPIGFDAVMRVRTSTGVRPTDFYGHFFMSNTTDIELGSIDSEKSVAIEIKHDDKLSPDENVYVQVALLYTSCSGQRRLRVLNLTLKICTQMADMFRSCDLDSMMLFLGKQSIFKLMESTPKTIKENLEARCARILACYRKNCATPISAGQLILPECMKLLPLYTSCMLKNDALFGGSDMAIDDRSYVMQFVLTMSLPVSVKFIYPRLIPLHDMDPDENVVLPAQIRCSAEKMVDNGAYILENGIHMFIWLGLGLSSEFCQAVFGVPHCQQIDTERFEFPVFDNPLSRRVRDIVSFYQQESTRCMKITFVRQRDKMEHVFKHFLIEDRGTNGAPSYVDFLCYMHKEIRQLLS